MNSAVLYEDTLPKYCFAFTVVIKFYPIYVLCLPSICKALYSKDNPLYFHLRRACFGTRLCYFLVTIRALWRDAASKTERALSLILRNDVFCFPCLVSYRSRSAWLNSEILMSPCSRLEFPQTNCGTNVIIRAILDLKYSLPLKLYVKEKSLKA